MFWVPLLFCFLAGAQTRDLKLEITPPVPSRAGVQWALVVGVSGYPNLPPAVQLRYAHRDAEDFAAFLRIPSSRMRLLTNERATLAAIRAYLHTWLADSVGPEDIVYLFFAGHGVIAERGEGYLLTSDSDAQNLEATALSFREMDETLSGRLRSRLTVMAIDACHSGRLGWSSFSSATSNRTAESLLAMGRGDRAFLKMLASSPSEQSFEDARWDGGHGIFTHALLEGLRGKADRDNDGSVRVAEITDFVGRIVPEQTASRQNPRVAGTFDARTALATVPTSARPPSAGTLDISGLANSAVYIDGAYRGNVRRDGSLRVEPIALGGHTLSVDIGDGRTVEGKFTLNSALSRMAIPNPAASPLLQLQTRIAAGRIMEPGGAWDYFRGENFLGSERAAARASMAAALEEQGQACVNDYVQSTAIGPKKAMLRRAADAYERLKVLRPGDDHVEGLRLFCEARFQIASAQFAQAVPLLQQAIRIDPQFACAYNAMGVALGRLNREAESRRAFEKAAELTPEWALPPFQLASAHVAKGEYKQALPYLEKAVQYDPRGVATRWNRLKVLRLLGRLTEVERAAADLVRSNPEYAPTYLELARAYEAGGAFEKASDTYDTYLLLAPNYADSDETRARSQRLRTLARRPVPSLRK